MGQVDIFQFPRKVSLPLLPQGDWENVYITVPQTDTGGLVEKTKANGRQMIKELGNKARRNLWEMPFPHSVWDAANEYLATVYLKHRSLQNRKVTYRG